MINVEKLKVNVVWCYALLENLFVISKKKVYQSLKLALLNLCHNIF